MYEGGRIGYFSGDILKLKDDLQSLRPTVFTSVPRLLYRLFDLTNSKVCKSPLKKSLLKFALKEKCRQVDKCVFRSFLFTTLVYIRSLNLDIVRVKVKVLVQ